MKPRFTRAVVSLGLLLAVGGIAAPAAAEQRFIVRAAEVTDPLLGPIPGVQLVTNACAQAGCTVQYGLGDDLSRLFLVTAADTVDPIAFVALLPTLPGIQHAEIDVIVKTVAIDAAAPPALQDAESVVFEGATVRGGYVRQPADSILGISVAREQYGLTGAGVTVAVIDTGIDPDHPALSVSLLQGYDFTRDITGASELWDLNQSTIGSLDDGASSYYVNQSIMAVLDQSTIGSLDDGAHDAFGHGTMVAGIIHLVAPRAQILPVKAFRADGSGYTSDVLRAIYFAVNAGAKVLNMSFSFMTPSPELAYVINYATSRGVIPVASAGNGGQLQTVYPAGLPNVIGVASTTDYDTLSSFSNYGTEVAWIAAPGEAIVTTYPLTTYAAGWGTSFSTPFAAGAAALLAEVSSQLNAADAHNAQGYGVWISPYVSRGRLHVPSAVQAWRTALGLP